MALPIVSINSRLMLKSFFLFVQLGFCQPINVYVRSYLSFDVRPIKEATNLTWPPGTNNNIYVAGDSATTAAAGDAAPAAADQ